MFFKPCKSCYKLFSYKAGEEWKSHCLPCYLSKQGKTQGPRPNPNLNATGIPDDILRKLIILCHPDKHGNSELSNATTAWLLNLKQKREEWKNYK
jgi:hypothetical protein